MNTCFSSLRLLSFWIDRYRLVHSSGVVMIMLPLLGRACSCYCRRPPPPLPRSTAGLGPSTSGARVITPPGRGPSSAVASCCCL